MSRNLIRPARSPRRRARWPAALAGALALGVAVAGLLAVESRPRADVHAPDAATAQTALAVGDMLRGFAESGASQGRLSLNAGEIAAALAAAGRLAPGAAAAARLEQEGVALELSLGAPHLPMGLWANLGLALTADAGGLRVASARIGRLPLPASFVEAGLLRGFDRALGVDGLGRAALAGIVGLAVEGDVVHVDVDFTPEARAALVAQLRARFDLAADGADTGPIHGQLYWLDRAGGEGELPRHGSVVPYLRHVIARAERMSVRRPELTDHDLLGAAFLALALYCGDAALGPAIGVTPPPRMLGPGNHCAAATLGGRDDLKRHFVVSAGLFAAGTGSAALGIGELKELLDSGAGGTGFSFDDMAANRAGARFAAAFLAAAKADWPAMLAHVGGEADVMPATDDLPTGMNEATFRERFGDVDSAAYAAMIAEIDRRIDALPFHRALPRS